MQRTQNSLQLCGASCKVELLLRYLETLILRIDSD